MVTGEIVDMGNAGEETLARAAELQMQPASIEELRTAAENLGKTMLHEINAEDDKPFVCPVCGSIGPCGHTGSTAN